MLRGGAPTGPDLEKWNDIFAERYAIPPVRTDVALQHVLTDFRPDVIFLHKHADLALLESVAGCGVPVVRMVHDHDLYCLRGYK